MTSKDKAKLGLAAGLSILAAVLFIFLAPPSRAISDANEAKTLWYCSACKGGFELTGAQTAEMARIRRPAAHASSDSPRPWRPGREVVEVTKCPFCGEWAGAPARRCPNPNCGQVFAARDKDGRPALCPDCKWDPRLPGKSQGSMADNGGERSR
jgi:hypothetical protein